MSESPDIFLSHNSQDKPKVRELREQLVGQGLTVWFDEVDLIAGRPWLDGIEKAIVGAKVIIATVGPSGLGPWETPEMRAALIQMVRRQAPVIPVLLPGAPNQTELPLFLQTLTWVDCRDGITEARIDRIVKSVQSAKAGSPYRPPETREPVRPNPPGSLTEFGRFPGPPDTGRGWTLWGSFAAPLIPLLLGLGPPWNGSSPIMEKGAVFLITAIVQLLAVTAAFFIVPPLNPNRMRRVMAAGLGVCVTAMAAYLILFVLFTEIQPNTSRRLIAGWKYSEYFDAVREDAGSIEDAKMSYGYRPLEIYEPWTVWCALLLVVFSWLAFFGFVVFYVSLFIRSIPLMRKESVSDDRAIVKLGLTQDILQTLHSAEVHTVGDLCALSERQLRHSLGNSTERYAAVASSLRAYGIQLRE
jgi:hypothetical protein